VSSDELPNPGMTAEVKRLLNGLGYKVFLRVAARIDDLCDRDGVVDEVTSFDVDDQLRALTVMAPSPTALTYYVVAGDRGLPVVNFLTVANSIGVSLSAKATQEALRVMKRVQSDGHRADKH
jgi:hypothetical protein